MRRRGVAVGVTAAAQLKIKDERLRANSTAVELRSKGPGVPVNLAGVSLQPGLFSVAAAPKAGVALVIREVLVVRILRRDTQRPLTAVGIPADEIGRVRKIGSLCPTLPCFVPVPFPCPAMACG